MKVLLADQMGMCFGVRDALAELDRLAAPETVTIRGELVHNEVVLDHLRERGFRMTPETAAAAIPPTDAVLITAHGISDRERERLQAAGKRLIDTTCPLVTRVHQAARQLQEQGYHVLVIGRPDHVEVRGIVEDLHAYGVVQGPDEVDAYPADRIGIVSQSTTPVHLAEAVRDRVARVNPRAEIRYVDTICQPTKDRQTSLELLVERVDAVVVVGGSNSNNTRRLVQQCADKGVAAYHVQTADDLDPQWFTGCRTVGLTAGTSTLGSTVEAVRQALLRLSPCERPTSGPLAPDSNV